MLRPSVYLMLPLLALSVRAAGAQGQVTSARVAVHVSQQGDTWTYVYSVTNGKRSSGPACWIDLDISASSNSVDLDTTRLPKIDLGSVLGLFYGRIPTSDKVVPVRPGSPEGWVGATGGNGILRWMAIDEIYELRPGVEIGGFSVISSGLPAVRRIVVSPFVDINDDDIPEEAGEDVRLMEEIRLSRSGVLQTIWPSAPPKQIVNRDFLLQIREYLDTSTRLQWLPARISHSLSVKLDAALASIDRANAKAAQGQLTAALHELRAQDGKQIPSEVAMLLAANISYLLEHWAS